MDSGTERNNTCPLQHSVPVQVSLICLLILVIVVGGTGNGLLSFLVLRQTKMRSVINNLLAFMSISDSFTSIFCTPLDLTSVVLHQWVFGSVICIVHSFFLSVFMIQNVCVLVIISVDRYFMLVYKKNRLHACSSRTLIIGCLTFAIFVSCPPLLGVGKFTFINEYCWEEIPKSRTGDSVYYVLFSSFLFVLPCGLLLMAYIHIVLTLRKTTHSIRPDDHAGVFRVFDGGQQVMNVRFKQKSFKTILCLYVVAMVFKLPLAITLLAKSATNDLVCPVSVYIMTLAYLNAAVNPFIYASKISTYWRTLTGKLKRAENSVKSLRKIRGDPASVYKISRASQSSVI